MSDPVANFEHILKENKSKRPFSLYSDNKLSNNVNLKPQDVISSVSLQLRAIQVADSLKSKHHVKKDLQKYKKSNLLSVNKLPVYEEVPKQTKFDTQCVSDTQLINIIEDAESIDVHRGMTQEFETTFCYHTEKQNFIKDDTNIPQEDRNERIEVACNKNDGDKDNSISLIPPNATDPENYINTEDVRRIIGKERLKPIQEEEIGLNSKENTEGNDSISLISPIMCSNNIIGTKTGINSHDCKIPCITQGETYNIDINTENEEDKSIERPLSPIFLHKNTKIKSKTPPPLIFNLDKFEEFEKIAIPIIESNDLKKAKHVINSQIIDKELRLNMNKEIDILSSVLQTHANNETEFTTHRHKDTDIEFIELDKVTSDDLIYKIMEEDSRNIKTESEVLQDEILFSSDEEENYIHKSYQDLPFTCALETSFYDQSDVLDKTVYVGFQTASNKSIQVLTDSFVKAKSMLSDVDGEGITVTDLVRNCDSVNSSTQGRANMNIDSKEIELNLGQQDDINSKLIESNEKPCNSYVNKKEDDEQQLKTSADGEGIKPKLGQKVDFKLTEDMIEIGSDFKMTEDKKIEKLCDANTIKITQDGSQAKLSIDDEESEFNLGQQYDYKLNEDKIEMGSEVKTIKNANNMLPTKNFEGFMTASQKVIKLSQKALARCRKVFQDIDLDENFDTQTDDAIFKRDTIENPETKLQEIESRAILKTDFENGEVIETSNKEVNKMLLEDGIDDVIIQEFENIEMSLEDDKEPDKNIPCLVFKTANNDIGISETALTNIKDVFKDIDFDEDLTELDVRDSKIKAAKASNSNNKENSFGGFKTASNKNIKISKEAIAKTINLFQDIDFIEFPNKSIEKVNYFDQPSTSKAEFVGFKTASNKNIKISDQAIAKTKNIFDNIDSIELPKKNNKDIQLNTNTDNDKLNQQNPQSTSNTKFLAFKTANNNFIKISKTGLAKSKKIFEDKDSADFNFNKDTKDDTNDLLRETEKEDFKQLSTSKNSFVGFKTASNKNIKISDVALAKTGTVFKDIDSTDFKYPKELNEDDNEKMNAAETETTVPFIKKTSFTGFKTANNREIKISDTALEKTKNVFKDIDSDNFKFKENSDIDFKIIKSIEATIKGDDSKINDKTEEFSKPSTSKASFVGFKTANNRQITISKESLAKTKIFFKDIDATNFKCPEKAKHNLKELENYSDDVLTTYDSEMVDINMPSTSQADFVGFKTASNRQIAISKESLAKTKNIFKDIDAADFKVHEKVKQDLGTINLVAKDEDRIYTGNKTNYNQALLCKTPFVGFETANNKKFTISEESLAKTRSIFKNIDSRDSEDIGKAEKDISENKSKENMPEFSSVSKVISQPSTSKASFVGFKTANNKKINISKESLENTRNIFKDIDNTDFEDSRKDIAKSAGTINKIEFIGFKTGNNDIIKISETALAKSKNIFKDIDFAEFKVPENDKKDYPDFKIGVNKHFHNNNTPKFQGFQTANNKQVKVSEDALIKSRKIFQDINDDNSKPYYLENKASFITNNFKEAEDINVESEDFEDRDFNSKPYLIENKDQFTESNSKVSNTDFPTEKSSPIFKGFFHTANKKPVTISKEALAKSKKLFQELEENPLEDLELEFYGFKSTNDDIIPISGSIPFKSINFKSIKTGIDKNLTKSDDKLGKRRKIVKNTDISSDIKFGSKTGSNIDVLLSNEAVVRNKRLFSEIDDSNENLKKNKTHEDNVNSMIDTQVLNNFEESLHTEDFRETPVKSKRSGSPILSCPRAKKRRKFETPYSQKIPQKEPKNDNYILKNVNKVTFSENYKKNKIYKLKDLSRLSKNDKTTIDPYLLQFNFDNLLNIEFIDNRNDLSHTNMTVNSLKELFLNSVNSKLVPKGWVENHLKLILWKLISYEIKFKSLVLCSARNVLDQLKYRYDRELYNAQRPALRKILEKDDVPSKTMVLCVAAVYVDGVSVASATTTNNLELLLTDGWYCIKATLDKMLAQLVCQQKIVVGTKIVTNSAELLYCEQGISPWEDTSAVRLKIFGNSTRRARWDARLGYHSNGAILSQLSSVKLDGGKVSKLRVLVTRVYPALYVEKFEDGSTVTRSERLEHLHQMRSEAERQTIMEKIYEEVEKEFSDQDSQDCESLSELSNKRTCLDSGSQIAKVMKRSKDPAEFRAGLTSSQCRLLEAHSSKRRELVLQNIQERVRDKIEKAGVRVYRNVVTLLKVRVAGVAEKNGIEVFKGMMSIWKPPDAVLEIIKEGAWIDVMNVVPTAVRYSEIQISAGRQSVFSPSKYKEPEKYKPYSNLLKRTCFTLKDLAKNPSIATEYNEIDSVGFIFLIDPSIKEFDSTKNPFQNIFLADLDKNMICINFWGGLKKFGFENVLDTGQVVYCVNLQKRAGNTRKNIPQYRVTEFSYFTKTPKNDNARIFIEEFNKKFSTLDRRKFCNDCVLLKNNYSVLKNNNENISPFRFNNSDYNISKNKMFIDSPLARPNKLYDNFNLTGLDFESTFKQDTQLPEEALLRKKKVNEKIARLKMYGEPPPLSTIHIINKSKNASNSYKSPLISNNNNSKIVTLKSNSDSSRAGNSKSDSSANVASLGRTPEKWENLNDTDVCSPVLMNRTYVKNVNPVKLNFDMNGDDSTIDHFAEEFDGSPPLSLD